MIWELLGDNTTSSLVKHDGTKTPIKVAFCRRYRIVTYGELLDTADCLSYTLHNTSLNAGEKVAACLPKGTLVSNNAP